MTSAASEGMRAPMARAADLNASPAEDRQNVNTEDRLMVKAQHIFDLAQKRDHHFQHPLMADRAMSVMLGLFIAEFSAASGNAAAPVGVDWQQERDVIDALLDAGLIERLSDGAQDHGQDHGLSLTPLGAGRMRSFLSASPEIV